MCEQTLTSLFSRFIPYVQRFALYLLGVYLHKRTRSCINTPYLHCSVVFLQVQANKPGFCNLLFVEKKGNFDLLLCHIIPCDDFALHVSESFLFERVLKKKNNSE